MLREMRKKFRLFYHKYSWKIKARHWQLTEGRGNTLHVIVLGRLTSGCKFSNSLAWFVLKIESSSTQRSLFSLP